MNLPDQRVERGRVTVESATLTAGGFVFLTTDTDASLRPILGHSNYLEAGAYDDVRIELDERIEDSRRLVAVVLDDASGDEFPDFDGSDEVSRACDERVTDVARVCPARDCSGPPRLALVAVHEDASGDERANLDDEFVVFENPGCSPLDLTGYVIWFGDYGQWFQFPDGFSLASTERVVVRTDDAAHDDNEDPALGDHDTLVVGSDEPILNNDGDRLVVRNADGETVLEREYA